MSYVYLINLSSIQPPIHPSIFLPLAVYLYELKDYREIGHSILGLLLDCIFRHLTVVLERRVGQREG